MLPLRSQSTAEPDENTPLLPNAKPTRKETPLPTVQTLVLLFAHLCEPIMSQSINPYISQLVRELPIVDGDEKKVGYYTGLIVSLYFAAESVTVLHWSRLSDKVGRKPILLGGLLGATLSSLLFGLSRSFPALVLSRCLNGMLNGNAGVMKSMVAELTDETNKARGFALLSVAWAVGCTLGPFFGGVLSRPQDRWPNLFSQPFWGKYPYFLPCLATATYALLAFSLVAIFLKETVKSDPFIQPYTEVNSDIPGEDQILDGSVKDSEKTLPLRALLTRPVVISVANYGVIGLLGIITEAVIPLVWSTSVRFGGLGMSPASIGLWMAGYGTMSGVVQLAAFPSIVRRFGPRNVFIASIFSFFPIYLMFPFQNLALRHSSRGLYPTTGLLILLQLSAILVVEMGFAVILMYISSAAPNKRSLGATNGIAQMTVSIQRSVGPALAASLFAFSLEKNILGGNFAYLVLLGMVGIGMGVAAQLPRNTWDHYQL